MSESLSIPPSLSPESSAAQLCGKVIRKYNALVEQFEQEHDLRLRLEVKLRLANEELAKLRAR